MNCFTSSLAVAACVLSEVLYPKPLKGLKEQSVWKVPFRGFRDGKNNRRYVDFLFVIPSEFYSLTQIQYFKRTPLRTQSDSEKEKQENSVNLSVLRGNIFFPTIHQMKSKL